MYMPSLGIGPAEPTVDAIVLALRHRRWSSIIPVTWNVMPGLLPRKSGSDRHAKNARISEPQSAREQDRIVRVDE
jgi:hypothetical protein